MNDKITDSFINEIKKKTDHSSYNMVQEILPLNKEAIYRRLTNKVAFTYVEAVKIAQKLNISLDQINNISIGGHLFKIDESLDLLPEEGHLKSLIYSDVSLSEYLNEENVHMYSVQSTVPRVFILNYKNLSRLKYYKWMHESSNLSFSKMMLDKILLSEEANLKKQDDTLVKLLRHISSHFIVADVIFENIIKDVKYFAGLGFVNDDDLVVLKKELLALIDEFENIVSLGQFENGGAFSVYLSDVHIDSNFGFVHTDSSELVFNRFCGMNYGLSKSQELFDIYKHSFDQLKSYTTLISQTSSSKRIAFFNKQRDFVEKNL